MPEQSKGRFGFMPVSPTERGVALVVLVLMFVACMILLNNHPSEASWFPKCHLYTTTGMYCPGCGASRSMHHLVNGRYDQAVEHNQLMVFLGVPVALFLAISSLTSILFGRRIFWVMPRWWGVALGVLVIGWFVIRNVPGFEVLQPPPPETSEISRGS